MCFLIIYTKAWDVLAAALMLIWCMNVKGKVFDVSPVRMLVYLLSGVGFVWIRVLALLSSSCVTLDTFLGLCVSLSTSAPMVVSLR